MGGGAHRYVTIALSAVLVLIGVAMLVSTLARGGGPLSYGVIAGLCFGVAGAARLWLALRGPSK